MLADLAGGLGAVGLFALPGYGLTAWIPSLRRLPAARRGAYGYLLGLAVIAGTLYVLSHLCGLPLRPAAIGAVVGVVGAVGVVGVVGIGRIGRDVGVAGVSSDVSGDGGGGGGVSTLPPGGALVRRLGGPVPAVCAAVAAALCCGAFAEAMANPVHDWDGRMTWSAQARYVRAAGTVDAGVLTNGRWFVSHPQYPLLLPVAQAAALEVMGADADAHLPRALYAAFLPVLLLVIYDGARRGAGPAVAAVAALALALAPFVVRGEGGAETAYSDLPLACFYGAALVLLLDPRRRLGAAGPARAELAAGLLLAAAVLTKNEGAILAPLAVALGWRRDRGWRRLAITAVPVLLALAFLASWRAGIPNRADEAYDVLVQAGGFGSRLIAHGVAFTPVVWRQTTSLRQWVGFWWVAAALGLAGHRILRRPRARRWALAAAGPLAIGLAAYAVHPRPDILATVTWNRFLLQASLPLTVLLAWALADVLRRRWGRWR